VLLGNYNGFSPELVSLLEGIINKVEPGMVVDWAQGTLLKADSLYNGNYQAGSSDVIIAAVGNSRLLEGEQGDALLSGSGDRNELGLPENQVELIRRLHDLDPEKPLIVVVFGGSAIALDEIAEMADALLFAWYPGEQGGNALADILFGNANPSGRLPVTFYSAQNALPPFDDYSMQNRTYRYFSDSPLYPFGYGLSYTTFTYSQAELKTRQDEFYINFTLTNEGKREGEEVIQLYVKRPDAEITGEKYALKGLKRVALKAGETKRISMQVCREDLQNWNVDAGAYLLHPGVYSFYIGTSSTDFRIELKANLH
jgi:beta-glucosidase